MDDGFSSESIEPPDRPVVRIRALNGWTIIMRNDPTTRLITLDSENTEGELVGSRVLGEDDAQRLREALSAALEQVKETDGPIVLDVSQVIGRD